MPDKVTISDVRDAGYQVAFASGSVEAEERALENARQSSSPAAIKQDVDQVARETARMALAQGLEGADLTRIVTTATSQALEQLRGASDARVRFHERALDIARSSPDVYVVSGDGFAGLYVACRPDGTGWDQGAQETLDALVASASK